MVLPIIRSFHIFSFSKWCLSWIHAFVNTVEYKRKTIIVYCYFPCVLKQNHQCHFYFASVIPFAITPSGELVSSDRTVLSRSNKSQEVNRKCMLYWQYYFRREAAEVPCLRAGATPCLGDLVVELLDYSFQINVH